MFRLVNQKASNYLSNLWRAIKIVWISSRRLTVLSFIGVLIQGLLPAGQLIVLGLLVDAVTRTLMNNTGSTDISPIVLPMLWMAGLLLLDTLLNILVGLMREHQMAVVSDHIMLTIHSKSIELDLEYYENSNFYDQLHLVQQEAPSRPAQIVTNLMRMGRELFTLLGISLVLLTLHPLVPFILLLSVFPAILVRLRYSRILFDWQRESIPNHRRASYYHYLLSFPDNAKEVRLFDTGHLFKQRYAAIRKLLREERLRIFTRRMLMDIGVQALAVIALFVTLLLVITSLLEALITLGGFVVVFQAFQKGQTAYQNFLSSIASLYDNNLFLRQYFQFLQVESKLSQPAQPQPVPSPLRTGIRFDNVSFHYANHTETVLDKVNLEIKPDEVIAIVGENGAGKTTLVKLLCRLYDPTAGCITIDGVDLREIDLNELRRTITVLFQDFSRYQLTARENIWLGKADSSPASEQVVQAAEKTGADVFLRKLPRGYETQLGAMFDDGQELSLGQWQKVGLARALLRDAQIIILDEPTSALDILSEHEIFQQFRELIQGRTGILISHRMSTVRVADRIYVLADHQIAEWGTHDDLMAENGIYAHLFRTQSQYYV